MLRHAPFGELLFQDDDSIICSRKFELAVSMNLRAQPIGEVVVGIGKSFLGVDYVANSLEEPGEERLVVNLRGLDCVLFCENSLALARCIKKNRMTFDDYKAEIQRIRYRGGIVDRYPSRLHYFSDHIDDNEKKGVVKNVTREIGGVPYTKKVSFMSTHPDSYRQLREHPGFVKTIRKQEAAINRRKHYHIPKEDVDKAAHGIQNGDIIGITTSLEGMDIAHTGIALWQNDKLHFMHAPVSGHKVQITEKPLAEYLAGFSKQIGIMVARPQEPV
jgi:hypothetical protein